jgi:hypothetical protein
MRKTKSFTAIMAVVMVMLLFISGLGLQSAAKKGGNFGEGLVCWWKFDEGSGTMVSDSSGRGNDGGMGGGAVFTNDALLGSAVDFSDPNGFAMAPHSPSLEPVTGTIEIWVKIDDLQNSDILRKTTTLRVRSNIPCAITVYGLRIRTDGTVQGFVANDDPTKPGQPWTAAYSPLNLLTTDTWHHIALRWDGSTVAVFVDGTLQDAEPYDPVPGLGLSYHGTSPIYFASASTWPPNWPGPHEFIGQLDDFRFYAHARSDVEIFTDYITGGHKPAIPPGQK